jgi:ATP-dependent DNA helicase RecQ
MTNTFLNAGFYLQYLWEMREKIEMNSGFMMADHLNRLSSFAISEFSHTKPERPSSQLDQYVTSFYSNLIHRGLPTFPSLFIERAMLEMLRAKVPIQEMDTAGTIRFVHGRVNQQVEERWINQLRFAHHPYDPRISTDQLNDEVFQEFQDQAYDSDAEKDFFTNYLPGRIGKELLQFVESQRQIVSMVSEAEAQLFFNQRVDFALEIGNIRAVFEIDGPQHKLEPQKSLDRRRDLVLDNNNWQIIRVPVENLQSGRYDPSTESQWKMLRDMLDKDRVVSMIRKHAQSPIWEDETGALASIAVLSPFAVARFQKTLLLAIDENYLSLEDEEWKLVVIERDLPFAQIGLIDFFTFIQNYQTLIGIAKKLPKVKLVLLQDSPYSGIEIPFDQQLLDQNNIEVIKISENQPEPFEFYNGDCLIDIAVLTQEIFFPLRPESYKRYLHTEGVGYEVRSLRRPVENRILRSRVPFPLVVDETSDDALQFFLQNTFRKSEFREGQLDILRRAISLRPVIGLLPTGAGKSLCYQLAALLHPGLTLIIAPLISLMADQIDNLNEMYAIDWVGYINSQQSQGERELAAQKMMNGEYLFVFISPERLQNKDFRFFLDELSNKTAVPYVVIDEAHCVSEWGHDFRTAYLKLGKTAMRYCKHNNQNPTIIALTGTASYAVLSDVQREIGVDEESAKIYPSNFKRKELVFQIENVPSDRKRFVLFDKLKGLQNKFRAGDTFFTSRKENTYCGIIFAPHVNGKFGVYPLSQLIAGQFKMTVGFFSGKIPATKKDGQPVPVMGSHEFQEYKINVQRSFKRNEFPLLVATKAFGMGIDKPNIRYTIHFNIPQSLESFYQEAGRAGRNREIAHCLVIFSDDKDEETNKMLKPETSSAEIRNTSKNRGGGDIHRLLFLFTQTYQGIQEERDIVQRLLEDHIYKHFNLEIYEEPISLFIDFGSETVQQSREKALYRLSIIGVVSDYTLDYSKRKFEVTATRLRAENYLNNLQNYIKRYKTREVSELVPEQIKQSEGRNTLEKCVSYLLNFIYYEIERKRRASIKTMVEVARSASKKEDPEEQNRYIWQQMLAYLEHSPFTEDLAKLSGRIDPEEWHQILLKEDDAGVLLLRSVDGVRQLLGGCRRALESDTENPGLLFLSSLARLLLPDPEVEIAADELKSSLNYLSPLPSTRQHEVIEAMYQELNDWLSTTHDFVEMQQQYSSVFLDVFPTRKVARMVYPVIPERSEQILVNLLFKRVSQFAENIHT